MTGPGVPLPASPAPNPVRSRPGRTGCVRTAARAPTSGGAFDATWTAKRVVVFSTKEFNLIAKPPRRGIGIDLSRR